MELEILSGVQGWIDISATATQSNFLPHDLVKLDV